MKLLLGIKRGTHRRDDAKASDADREFAASREAVLKRAGWKCVCCGWKSEPAQANGMRTSLQVHHANDDHADNAEENLKPLCQLDHAYHHVGCDAPSPGGHQGLASQMRIAAVPWLEPQDLNLLQMAIGAAWADPATREVAKAVYAALMPLSRPVQDGWGTHHAKDFAAAMARLTPAQYQARKVDGLRVLFHPDLLQQLGKRWVQDYPLMSPQAWGDLVNPDVVRRSSGA